MAQRICIIPDCDGTVHGRGLCSKHYQRLRGAAGSLQRPTTADLFWAKVDKSGDCWIWTGCMLKGGYGRLNVGRKAILAHRYAYELLIGPIPAGMDLGHDCHDRDPMCLLSNDCPHRRCVNPAHLIPMTRRENAHRSPAMGSKTHCIRGHEFTEANTYYTKGRKGNYRRSCKACRKAAHARYVASRSAA